MRRASWRALHLVVTSFTPGHPLCGAVRCVLDAELLEDGHAERPGYVATPVVLDGPRLPSRVGTGAVPSHVADDEDHGDDCCCDKPCPTCDSPHDEPPDCSGAPVEPALPLVPVEPACRACCTRHSLRTGWQASSNWKD